MLLAVAACSAGSGRLPPGYEGLGREIRSFYDARALEENALCPQPRMTSIAEARVVEETPDRAVPAVFYHYRDEGVTADLGPTGGTRYGCDGWGERTFTVARGAGRAGGSVLATSGPQRSS